MENRGDGRLPKPKDLTHHLSRNTRDRQASSMKQFYKYFAIPGIGQLAGGLPNPYYFPFDDLEGKSALPDRWTPTPNKPVDPPIAQLASINLNAKSSNSKQGPTSANVVVPHFSPQPDPLRKIDLASALQYGTAQGYPPLYYFVRQFTRENLHPNHQYEGGPEVILTVGATDGFAKAIMALSNEWSEERDWIRDREGILVEEFCYGNAMGVAKPRGLNVAPVGMDDEGMRAGGKGGLADVLENWDYSKGRRPHLMYTVTIGQNPTGGSLSVKRRQEIYALCSKYDVIIIEDDPYWYLQYPSANKKRNVPFPPCFNTENGGKSSGYDFLDSMIPSYVSLDTDGRVVRLDTFSKTVAPGCRLGWITAQPDLIERVLRITETSTQQPSGFVQSMIAELIMGPQSASDGGKGGTKDGKGWNVDGWVRWLEGLRGNYERRMNLMCTILDEGKYIVKTGRRRSLEDVTIAQDENEWSVVEKTRMYSFDWPFGGMFVWLTLHFDSHPLHRKVPHSRLSRAQWVLWTVDPFKILVSPGTIFSPTEELQKSQGWKCFRLCFAACDESEVRPFTDRVVNGIKKFWTIKDKSVIDELLKDDEAAFGIDQIMNLKMDNDSPAAMVGGPC